MIEVGSGLSDVIAVGVVDAVADVNDHLLKHRLRPDSRRCCAEPESMLRFLVMGGILVENHACSRTVEGEQKRIRPLRKNPVG